MNRIQSLSTLVAFAAALIAMVSPAFAELKSQTVEYKQGDATLKSYLAFDDSAPLPVGATKEHRPGVLVIPEWWGLNGYAKHRADELAKQKAGKPLDGPSMTILSNY